MPSPRRTLNVFYEKSTCTERRGKRGQQGHVPQLWLRGQLLSLAEGWCTAESFTDLRRNVKSELRIGLIYTTAPQSRRPNPNRCITTKARQQRNYTTGSRDVQNRTCPGQLMCILFSLRLETLDLQLLWLFTQIPHFRHIRPHPTRQSKNWKKLHPTQPFGEPSPCPSVITPRLRQLGCKRYRTVVAFCKIDSRIGLFSGQIFTPPLKLAMVEPLVDRDRHPWPGLLILVEVSVRSHFSLSPNVIHAGS